MNEMDMIDRCQRRGDKEGALSLPLMLPEGEEAIGQLTSMVNTLEAKLISMGWQNPESYRNIYLSGLTSASGYAERIDAYQMLFDTMKKVYFAITQKKYDSINV